MSTRTTRRQAEVLATIDALAQRNGYAPSIRELGATLGITSTNGVKDHLRVLSRQGLISWHPFKARTLALTQAGRRFVTNAQREAFEVSP